KVITKADKVIYVSSYLKDFAYKELGTAGNWTIIFNGIAYPPPPVEVAKKEELVILSVANLIPRKGLDILIKAFSLVSKNSPSRAVLRIVGDGPERKKLQQLAEELELKEQVVLLGRKNHAEVNREMANCDIFCLPSWHEGFGVVYLEAMAYGKPVIGCKNQGINDLVVDGINGFLVGEGDVLGLANCLRELMINSDLRREIGRAGRDTVKERFTLAKEAADLKGLYSSLLVKS
ncbi:MAG TPA: glycosyltransferase family 4 protein, partial [Clostridia bacterium]|nr:glycosyltransferase family 4 protein [Clostridia bacterium]